MEKNFIEQFETETSNCMAEAIRSLCLIADKYGVSRKEQMKDVVSVLAELTSYEDFKSADYDANI